jgi:hypothetical protein
MSAVSIPANGQWFYAELLEGPRLKEKNGKPYSTYVSWFEIRDSGECEAISQSVALRFGFRDYDFMPKGKVGASALQTYIVVVAPHVIGSYLKDREAVLLTSDGEIDVTAWRKSTRGARSSLESLAEDLDGGRREHLRLCREDILRILMVRYDETPIRPRNQPFQVPDAAEMSVQDLWSSPLKRRYYAEQIWRSEAARLYGEKMIAGHGDGGPFWIDPQFADVNALRELVEEYDRRALEGTQRSSAPKRFFRGERSKAWQEVRRIVGAAAQHVWIEDNYVGSDVISMLAEDLPESANLRVLGPAKENKWWEGALASLRRLGADLPGRVEVRVSEEVHERYIYVDGNAWRSSESFKDMAAKKTTRITDEGERSAETVADFQKRWNSAMRVFPP